jgi:signal peptidase I
VTRISPRAVRRAIDAILVVLVALVGVVALISVVGPHLGYRPFLIRGSSMEPTIPRGAVALASEDATGTVRPGDVVSFTEANGVVVTHRVVAIDGTGPGALLTMKGDANPAADAAPIPAARVLGRVVASVPYLGYLAAMLTMPVGLLSIGLLALGLFIVGMLVDELGRGPCPACAEAAAERSTDPGSAGAPA